MIDWWVNASSGDSTQLLYLRARYYVSDPGRFITKDKWQGDMLHPLTMNKWNYVGSNPINRADHSGLLYLTFDDGPYLNDVTILDHLKLLDAKANFFFVGEHIDLNNPLSREIVWRVAAEGHRLGNHTYNHINITTECWDDVLQSILDADYQIEEVLKYVKRTEPSRYHSLEPQIRDYIDDVINNGTGLFRPPGGDITVSQKWLLEAIVVKKMI